MKMLLTNMFFLIAVGKVYGNPVTSTAVIEPQRKFASIQVQNNESQDSFCSSVLVSYRVVGSEFGETVGEFSENLGLQYFRPNEFKNFEGLGQKKLEQISTNARPLMIASIDMDLSSCRKAQFVDYCNYAEKEKSELDTLKRVFEVTKSGLCEDVEGRMKGKLKLSGLGIENVKPLSYLVSVRELNLAKNNILDLSSLSSLVHLVKVDVSKNPLKEIDGLLELPNVEYINASDTHLEFRSHLKRPLKLKKLYVRNTPFEKRVKELKNR